MVFVILSVIAFIITLFSKRNVDFFQPEVFLNIYFIVLIGAGPIALYFFSIELFSSEEYQNVIKIVLLGYLSINLGYYLAARRVNVKFSPITPSSIAEIPKPSSIIKNAGIIFIFIGLLSALIFFARAGGVPLLAKNKEVARVAALSVGGNGYFLYLMTIGMYGVALLAIYTFFFRKEKKTLLIFFLAIGLAMTGTGSRRYLLWLALYVFISRHYLYSSISNKTMAVFSSIGLLFVNLFEMFRNPDSLTTTDLSTTFLFRFVLYISNLEKVFTAFIKSDNFEYGSTFFMDILTILPGKQVDYQSWLKNITHLEFEGFGIPPTIMGDMYINFGYVGIVVGCVLFGFIIRSIYNQYILKTKNLNNVFLYMLSLEIASKVITSGISAQSVSLMWLGIFLVLHRFINTLLEPSIG
ncbi:O-antigen polymerase [Mucilaginibacter aquaedulcis]|uniref:O-antigen polymerase n=1 Tax=Mucilaginibacter aquaedulcis TaxID=1187081 RepID=UPI0025B55325|nr:O-antigen polymerase [Mucilaginibacter aquaedulcis]MDN3549758.1 O-antigen polymerase [Mucilaginibacter aquaedulcis]